MKPFPSLYPTGWAFLAAACLAAASAAAADQVAESLPVTVTSTVKGDYNKNYSKDGPTVTEIDHVEIACRAILSATARAGTPLSRIPTIVAVPLPLPPVVPVRLAAASAPSRPASAPPAVASPPPEKNWAQGTDPALFPATIPDYPGAEDEMWSIAEPAYGLTFHTADPPAKVIAFYEVFASKGGWTVQKSSGEHAFLVATRADETIRIDAVENDVDHDTEVFVHVFVQPPSTPAPAKKGLL